MMREVCEHNVWSGNHCLQCEDKDTSPMVIHLHAIEKRLNELDGLLNDFIRSANGRIEKLHNNQNEIISHNNTNMKSIANDIAAINGVLNCLEDEI